MAQTKTIQQIVDSVTPYLWLNEAGTSVTKWDEAKGCMVTIKTPGAGKQLNPINAENLELANRISFVHNNVTELQRAIDALTEVANSHGFTATTGVISESEYVAPNGVKTKQYAISFKKANSMGQLLAVKS